MAYITNQDNSPETLTEEEIQYLSAPDTLTEKQVQQFGKATPKLPRPSVEERVIANLMPSREGYLQALGKSPKEPGWFYDVPGITGKARELTADILETGARALPLASQIAGEAGGALIGGTTGALTGSPIGVIGGAGIGRVLGGAAGAGGAQALTEAYTKARGIGVPGTEERISALTGAGGVSSALGMGLSGLAGRTSALGATKALTYKLPGMLGTFKDVLKLGASASSKALQAAGRSILTNITKLPEPMQQWLATLHNGYSKIKEIRSTAPELVDEIVNKRILPAVRVFKLWSGNKYGSAKKRLFADPVNKVNPQDFRDAIVNLGREQVASAAAPSKELRRVIAELDDVFSTTVVTPRGSIRKIPRSGITLQELKQKLTDIKSRVKPEYAGVGEAYTKTDPLEGFFKRVEHIIDRHIDEKFPMFAQAKAEFTAEQKIFEVANNAFGEDAKAKRMVKKILFSRESEDLPAQRAFYALSEKGGELEEFVRETPGILTKGESVGPFAASAKFLGAAEDLSGVGDKTSGFLFGLLPKFVGASAGGTLGYITAPEESTFAQRLSRGAIGAGLGASLVGAGQYAFLTKRGAVSTLAALERLRQSRTAALLRQGKGVGSRVIPTIIEHSPKLLNTPMASSVLDIYDKHGLDTTDQDRRKTVVTR